MAKLWTILSPTSPGKTSLQLNLAYLYAKLFVNEKVLAVDFNFFKPDLAAFLDLTSNSGTKSLADIYDLLIGYQTVVLNDYLSIPFPERPNLKVLPGDLEKRETFREVPRDQWFKLFRQLRESSDLLLFDAGRELEHTGMQYLIAESDLLFVCTEADPLALLHTRSLLNSLITQGRLNDIRLVLLRYQPKSAYSLDYITDLLPVSVHSVIPEITSRDYQRQFLDTRLLADDSKHPYTKALVSLLEGITEVPEMKVGRNVWQRSLMKKFLRRPQNT